MQKQTDGCNLAYDQKAKKKQSQKKKNSFYFFNNFFCTVTPSQSLIYTVNIPHPSKIIAIYQYLINS